MWKWAIVTAVVGLSAAAPPTPLEDNSWALLVAGSNGWWNYRHQADVCHSYSVMINEGIPPERIVVMMYDDIAYDRDNNPNIGVVINRPNGVNVYAGVKIDYKGDDVNAGNFLQVLSGNKTAMKNIGTGRVIESNEKTNVFVYFADHGAPGFLSFPNDNLYADDLLKTFKRMHDGKQYNKLIMYVEACESGSMFNGLLPEDTQVFAMTAAAPDESSYGWYCEDETTCLGDEFSVMWLEHMDQEGKGTLESFFHQFQKLRTLVTKSHVNIYGDFSIGPNDLTPNKDASDSSVLAPNVAGNAVNSRDVALHYYKQKVSQANDAGEKKGAQEKLDDLIRGRKKVDKLFEELVETATSDNPKLVSVINKERLNINLDVFPCYKRLIGQFHRECFGHEHEYIIQHFYKFANMCLAHLNTDKLIYKMGSLCSTYKASVKITVV